MVDAITFAEPVNDKQYVTGALNTFVFNIDTGTLAIYPDGGITLNLPVGFQAIGGLAVLSGTPTANVLFTSVVVTDGVAKLKVHKANYAQAIGEDEIKVCAAVFAKRG